MSSLKILFLSHSFAPSIGGIEASSELLAGAFVSAGHNVVVMTITSEDNNEKFPYKVIRNPNFLLKLKYHIWADIVYENNPCIRLAWPKLFFVKPSVIALHTWISRTNGTITFIDKLKTWWVNQATQVIAVSKALQQRCSPHASIIGNSYDMKLFGIRPVKRQKDFVFLGRLVSDKGVELAIRAFNELIDCSSRPELKEITLTIIGNGPDRKHLEYIVAQLAYPDRIRFTGPLQGEDLVLELNQHTFQLIPSVWEEPFGIVALEGIACGLIPIASDGGGLPDAVGEAGVLFKRGQIQSLIATTLLLLQSPAQQAQCRAAAPKHLASFSLEAITEQYLSVLESAAGDG